MEESGRMEGEIADIECFCDIGDTIYTKISFLWKIIGVTPLDTKRFGEYLEEKYGVTVHRVSIGCYIIVEKETKFIEDVPQKVDELCDTFVKVLQELKEFERNRKEHLEAIEDKEREIREMIEAKVVSKILSPKEMGRW